MVRRPASASARAGDVHSRDPNDNIIVGADIAGDADSIVCGDEDPLALSPIEGMPVRALADLSSPHRVRVLRQPPAGQISRTRHCLAARRDRTPARCGIPIRSATHAHGKGLCATPRMLRRVPIQPHRRSDARAAYCSVRGAAGRGGGAKRQWLWLGGAAQEMQELQPGHWPALSTQLTILPREGRGAGLDRVGELARILW